MKYKGMICDRCGVKVTHSRVRRKRMGHIELAAPVVHIWFFKAMPSRLGTLLDMKTTSLEKIIYFQDYVVVDPGETPLKERQLLTEDEYRKAASEYGDAFEADMGAEAIKKLLEQLDLVDLSRELRERLDKETARGEKTSKQREKELVKRLKIVEALRDSAQQAASGWSWSASRSSRRTCGRSCCSTAATSPPATSTTSIAASSTATTGSRSWSTSTRRKSSSATRSGCSSSRSMRCSTTTAASGRCSAQSNRPLKSLTDMIKGKQGRFRENLLGKRVDYSARSVIVVGPELKLHQCGLPKKIALELFQPFIIRRLKELRPRRHDQVGQEDARAQGRRRSGTSSKRSSRTTRCCSTARRRCTAWASRRSSRC